VRLPYHVTRKVLIVPVVLAAGAVSAVPMTAAAAGTRPARPASFLTIGGSLRAVAVASAGDAWAVGSSGTRSLIVHWNGRTWSSVPSPSPASPSSLYGVTATSARNAWAVGVTGNRTLILHWNGRIWARVSSPGPGNSSLYGVAATSATSAWAVGTTGARTLILHWNGKTWARLASQRGFLSGIAVTSARNAWAVGSDNTMHTLILHWNGKSWKRSASPGAPPHAYPFLNGIAAISARRTWAVGDSTVCGCGPGESMTLRWTGRAWKGVRSPSPGGGTTLFSVAAVSASRAWAVGISGEGDSLTKAVILRWNGTAWARVASPEPRASSGLFGVATTAGGRAWAVGSTTNKNRAQDQTLILRWNGTSWK
jgi:hypothetical protein